MSTRQQVWPEHRPPRPTKARGDRTGKFAKLFKRWQQSRREARRQLTYRGSR